MEGSTNNLHPDGLYSVEIFGRVGDKLRRQRFSYIDIKIPILHPIIYKRLIKLRGFYRSLMSGKEYGKWDETNRDFVAATELDGETGYQFFISHWDELTLPETDSEERRETIALFNKYRHQALVSKIVVMPAGYRDITEENGRLQEDEVNSFYKRLLTISNTVTEQAIKLNPAIYDKARFNLQVCFFELYTYIEQLVEGKKKLLMGKWASRHTFDGTRNVITAMTSVPTTLLSPDDPGIVHTQVGLYQTAKGIRPVTINRLRSGLLHEVFMSPDMPVRLIDKKTYKQVDVRLPTKAFDLWGSVEGIEKLINRLAIRSRLNKPIEIEGHYLALLYRDDTCFKVFRDISELPEQFDRSKVKPLTLAELFYITLYPIASKYPVIPTRYPVTGPGSTYPSLAYLRTTVKAAKLKPLNGDWELDDNLPVAPQFPIASEQYINSLIPHSTRLAFLGADFDGDTMNGLYLYSDDAIEEIRAILNSKKAYVGSDGKPLASIGVATLDLLFHNLTRD